MRRAKPLQVVWIALIIACLLSVPAFSGEHPWDSDSGNNGGTTGSGGSGDDATTPVVLKAHAGNGNTHRQFSTWTTYSMLFRVSTTVGQWYSKWFEAGTRVDKKQATRVMER